MALVKRGPHHNSASPVLRGLLEFRMSFAGRDGLIFQNARLCVLCRQIFTPTQFIFVRNNNNNNNNVSLSGWASRSPTAIHNSYSIVCQLNPESAKSPT